MSNVQKATEITIPQELVPLYKLINQLNGNPDSIFKVMKNTFPRIQKRELVGRNRASNITRPRHMAFYALHTYGLTFKRIGEIFGNRDHATVIYGVRRITKEIDRNCLDHNLFEGSRPEKMGVNRNPPQVVEVTDRSNSTYHLGDVRTFSSVLESLRHREDLGELFGQDNIKAGPAIDLFSKQILQAQGLAGFYFHKQAQILEEQRKMYAPILGTKDSYTLEEVLTIVKSQ
ncbi:MAG: helix-turn-helix domain-containing protein [Nanoarchaeota archaeon]